jgi:hypothetical protein
VRLSLLAFAVASAIVALAVRGVVGFAPSTKAPAGVVLPHVSMGPARSVRAGEQREAVRLKVASGRVDAYRPGRLQRRPN